MSTIALDNYLTSHGLILQETGDITKGRKVISTRNHERGHVLITSQPLGTIPLPSRRQEICNYCFRKPQQPTSLQRCSQCKTAYFCDKACFKNAWLTYHQYVCRPNSATQQLVDDDDQDALDLEMLERVALNCWRYNKRKLNQQVQLETISTEEQRQEENVDATMEAFYSLMDHKQSQPKHTIQRFSQLSQKALSRVYLKDSGLTTNELVQCLCRFQCNNFGVHDDHLFTIGEGTYPVASLINHSCRPNAIVMFDGALLCVVAIENIQPDQEVTISYVDAAHDRSHRQSTLFGKYFFHCDCVRCLDDTNIYGEIDSLLGNEASDWDRAQALLMENNDNTLRSKILQQVNDWDLLEMCRLYDRKHDAIPDPTKPLDLATYTHFVIQFFAPYLWSVNNPSIRLVNERSPSSAAAGSSSRSSTPPPLPSPPSRGLSHFDDPLPHLARPMVPDSYQAILQKVMSMIRSYPVDPDVVPFHLTTLSASTQLLYDEMNAGNWRNAVKLGMYVLIQYCWIYPPYHPILAQHILLLAKCSWNSIIKSELLGDGKALETVYERGVRRWLMLSKEALACCVGKKGDQWRELIELEWIFLREQKLKE
ncbi:uncharacterized protein BX664DRAFT_331316 [Halteromyces radiatus]|uniref:uncharacterized protein n=1 Tax=Halteromyces radiatus TaxID=101107 RepID=UPI00221F6ABC|nr:uncharacterized protein BX664DRAFT_331316 [Halteromyces radiatus]KAI8088764.1 hypothetical protein BX664DRAFT_331316 [Halteromyces radiatus]